MVPEHSRLDFNRPRQRVPNMAQPFAGAKLPLHADLQYLHDRSGAKVRFLTR